jgi:hypothetical protein
MAPPAQLNASICCLMPDCGGAWLRRQSLSVRVGGLDQTPHVLSAMFRRLAARRGVKRASIAIAHAILTIPTVSSAMAPFIATCGPDYFDTIDPARLSADSSNGSKGLASTSR